MIITLVKADFSSNNIGALGNFSVLSTLDSGLTFIGDPSIVIGGTYTGKIEASSKYMISNIVVTVNGEVLENVVYYTSDMSSADIVINGVTGDVVIIAAATLRLGDIILLQTSGGVGPVLSSNSYAATATARIIRNQYLDRIEVVAMKGANNVATEPVTAPDLSVWVFNAETNTPVEQIMKNQSVTSVRGTNDEQVFVVPIKKAYDFDVYFGYCCYRTNENVGIGYISGQSGNYLSGTPFEIGQPITVPSGTQIAIYAHIYGEEKIAAEELLDLYQTFGDFDAYTAVAAENVWIAQRDDIIPAGVNIRVVDVGAHSTTAGYDLSTHIFHGCNILVINAETGEIIDWPVKEISSLATYNSVLEKYVLRFDIDKTYDVPVFLMFNATRISNTGIRMGTTGGKQGIMLADTGDTAFNFYIGAVVPMDQVYQYAAAYAIYN